MYPDLKKLCEEMEVSYAPSFNTEKLIAAHVVYRKLKDISDKNSFGEEGLVVWCAQEDYKLTIHMTDYSIVIDANDLQDIRNEICLSSSLCAHQTPYGMVQLEIEFDLR